MPEGKEGRTQSKTDEEKESFRWLEGLRSTHEAALAVQNKMCLCL